VNEFFSIYLIIPAAVGPGVHSASNINKYKKQKNNVSVEQFVGLTVLPPSVSRLFGQRGILNIRQPYRPPLPVTGITSLYFYFFLFASIQLLGSSLEVRTYSPSTYVRRAASLPIRICLPVLLLDRYGLV
jgi:hypothetical protein